MLGLTTSTTGYNRLTVVGADAQDTQLQLVYAHLNKGNISSAREIVSQIKSTQPNLANYLAILINLQILPNKEYSLVNRPADIDFLTNYANNQNNVGYGGAQALLQFVMGTNYTVPRLLPIQDGSGSRLLNNQQNNDVTLSEVDANFKVFPNPTEGILNFECKILNDGSSYRVEIINSLGQIVSQSTIINQQSIINIKQLNSGIYMLNAYNGKTKIYQTKIVKVN